MRNAVTVRGIIRERGKSMPQSRKGPLESRMTGNGPVRFGGGPMEKERKPPRQRSTLLSQPSWRTLPQSSVATITLVETVNQVEKTVH